jgi:two-component system response regulator CpxR
MPETPSARPILVVDDDRKLCGLIRDYLEPLGFAVSARHTGPEGLEEALAGSYEAVILDVMMPGMDGFEVLRELRKRDHQVPVLMLTALGEEADRIVGLEIGADDYLPKTFSTRELLARLRAVMRRSQRIPPADRPPADLVAGPLRLNEATHTAALGDQPLDLTALEFAILTELIKARGRVKTREQLLDAVADRRFDVFDRSIDVHISALRKKLGDDARNPRFIRTIRGVGYVLAQPDHPR